MKNVCLPYLLKPRELRIFQVNMRLEILNVASNVISKNISKCLENTGVRIIQRMKKNIEACTNLCEKYRLLSED